MNDIDTNDINDKILTTINPHDRLKLLKVLHDFSYKQIADKCRCSKAQIVLIFQDKYYPTNEIKNRLADCFGVNPLQLWKEK